MYKCADNPEGGLDDATIAQLEGGVAADRLAFLDGFISAFFSVGGKLMVSEAQRVYARDIASFASPKATLDCIAAFSYTDFRIDLAQYLKAHPNVLENLPPGTCAVTSTCSVGFSPRSLEPEIPRYFAQRFTAQMEKKLKSYTQWRGSV